MTTLVVGASGATGRLLVTELIRSGQQVRVIVRPSAAIPESWQQHSAVTVIRDSLAGVSSARMAAYLADCQAVASCLGHNPSLKGIFGKPRDLVTAAVRLICDAIAGNAPATPVKFVLMNTAGNRNRDLNEPASAAERIVTALLRLLVPPHPDNEKAADYLRLVAGQNNRAVEWVVVRPDTLIDLENVTPYSLHASPTRSALFNSGKTSRINVAHFMADLLTDAATWTRWKGQMPVIYNKTD